MAEKTKKTPKLPVIAKQTPASKVSLNLSFHKSSVNPIKLAVVILVILIAAAAFVKIGIMDRLEEKNAAYEELSSTQSRLAAVKKKLVGYDELAADYGRYSYGWMTDSEASLIERPYVLGILENTISPVAGIQDFALNNNILAVNIFGVTLDETSSLVKELEADPQIVSVSVYKAKTDDEDQKASVSMTIILQKVEESGNED